MKKSTLLAYLLFSTITILAQKTVIPPPATLDCYIPDSLNQELPKKMINDINFPSVNLKNQDGETVNFKELVKGKVVVLNCIFTSCDNICKPMSGHIAYLNGRFAEAVEKEELIMISVSIDPTVDTPEKLKQWSVKYPSEPGWTLLTGAQTEIDELLKNLNIKMQKKEDHEAHLFIGNSLSIFWMRTNAVGDPEKLEGLINLFLG